LQKSGTSLFAIYINPWLEWNLTDRYGKRIGGGMYIVHINAPGIGEKVVKWFGALSER